MGTRQLPSDELRGKDPAVEVSRYASVIWSKGYFIGLRTVGRVRSQAADSPKHGNDLILVSHATLSGNILPAKFLDRPDFGSFVLVIRVCFALKPDLGR